MATYSTTCLLTTLKNTSGSRRFFGYLPPHGKTLAANQVVTFFGHFDTILGGIDRHESKTAYDHFTSDLSKQLIEIISTPAVILQDTVTPFASKQIQLTSGSLVIHDPSYDTSIGP